jgi:hypothetical protein
MRTLSLKEKNPDDNENTTIVLRENLLSSNLKDKY